MGRLEGYLGIPDAQRDVLEHIYQHREQFMLGGSTRGGFIPSDLCRSVLQRLGGLNCVVQQIGERWQAHCIWQKRLLWAEGRDNAEATARLLMLMYGAQDMRRGQIKPVEWSELKSMFEEEP